MDETVALTILFVAAALLYSSVGHAGASAYLGAMALLGVAPATMRPTALALNVLVASIVSARYARAGLVHWPALVPFIAASIPLAFVGGGITLQGGLYRVLVGLVLLAAAARLAWTARDATDMPRRPTIPVAPALAIGGGIGLLAGLTGTGGGIFLTPIIVFAGWADTRTAAGLSAVFILANSVAGLAGNVAALRVLPPALPVWLVAVAAAALLGTELGTRRIRTPALRLALAAVLAIAGSKLILIG